MGLERCAYIFPALELGKGQEIDIWAYYNNADEGELYRNDVSLGKRKTKVKICTLYGVKYELRNIESHFAKRRKDGVDKKK